MCRGRRVRDEQGHQIGGFLDFRDIGVRGAVGEEPDFDDLTPQPLVGRFQLLRQQIRGGGVEAIARPDQTHEAFGCRCHQFLPRAIAAMPTHQVNDAAYFCRYRFMGSPHLDKMP
jgi:hypothetical protein